MKKNKLKHFQSLLENIRTNIVGVVEKSHHNIKSNEVQQMANIIDDAVSSHKVENYKGIWKNANGLN